MVGNLAQALAREIEPRLDVARAVLAEFLGAGPDDVAFVPNATAGVNAVLRSLDFDEHDELLVTTHEYNASRNALDFVAGLTDNQAVGLMEALLGRSRQLWTDSFVL